ncbi:MULTISPECIES: Holliday junction resolvase RuvX [unclassified Neisseria]|uniref:Holliday junction resolvase RuvX n=1 Tax=unclassified Neisseria TaxID=2623750 RepID=UPI002665955E|nr:MULTISPECIES: Holliday junction resolvase RuvX [unclassified Neisseria]MDO1509117.1 Holliday junction resolvase RuvX [Neisseria sp. MVDL19-042950]MDO1516788.1 Holliday junction resolvase RuvX [Neisseria sp. MVDL18-041461]MDO1564000.1 Holliday junction resolvase RuvX [Neisseria sp. MVDL20-010259]
MLKAPHGTTLAFDFGEARIGVAEGDAEVGTVHPLATVAGEGNDVKFAAIAKLVDEWQPVQLVVGLPVHADGTEHELTRLSRKFGRRLQGRFRLPVYWVDERMSSLYAESLLAEAQVFGRKQKQVLDQVAAQAILQSFFEGGAAEYFNGGETG